MLALLVLALAAAAPEPPSYQPASAEECQVIDAAVGSAPATTVAVPPEEIMPPTDPAARAIYGVGRPPIAEGQPAADISHCLRANRPFDPLPGSDTATIISRATIDDASGRAVMLYGHRCGVGGVIKLTRDRNGDWTRTGRKQMWSHSCNPLPVAARPHP
jgi:hypothetical protein